MSRANFTRRSVVAGGIFSGFGCRLGPVKATDLSDEDASRRIAALKVRKATTRRNQYRRDVYDVMISFDQASAQKVHTLTARYTGGRVAMILNGRELPDAQINSPIPDGVLVMTGSYPKSEAQRLATRLGGRGTVIEMKITQLPPPPPTEAQRLAYRVREVSLETLAQAGLPLPFELPYFVQASLRDQDEVVDRIRCLHAVVAAANGLDRATVQAWAISEGIRDSLTVEEARFLADGIGNAAGFGAQAEALWALSWCAGLAPHLDFWRRADEGFSKTLPDIQAGESSERLRAAVKLRSVEEVIQAADLAYCLHAALARLNRDGKPMPGKLEPSVVIWRRWALQWLVGKRAWDQVDLRR